MFYNNWVKPDTYREAVRSLKMASKEQELSEEERKMLQLIFQDKTDKEIADKLSKSPRTIGGYRQRLYKITGTSTAGGMVAAVFTKFKRFLK